MSRFGENLARLRVAAATGTLDPDLGQWAVRAIIEFAPAVARVGARNHLLREAAAHLSGSTRAKARRIVDEIARARRQTIPVHSDADPVSRLVAEAMKVDPNTPTSWRQIFSIVQCESL